MQEQCRPERLVEYLCTVGLSSPLTPLFKDGLSPSTPLHSLCLVYNRDEPPPLHSKLDMSYYGEPANLNAGNPNFLSPSVFLCLSRSPSSPPLQPDDDPSRPITDVIVVYPDRNEKPPPGYVTAPVVGGGGGKSSPYGKSVSIAYSRQGVRPLLDLVLCEGGGGGGLGVGGVNAGLTGGVPPPSALLASISAPTPSSPLSPPPLCAVPPHYVLLKKSVAMGAFHHSTFLAILPSPTSLSSLLLRPVLLDRYPRVDLPSSPLPESLPFFAFPEGASILPQSSPPPQPSVSTFVLTQPSGLLLHAASVTFYEPCSVSMGEQQPQQQQQQQQQQHNQTPVVKASRRLSLASGAGLTTSDLSIPQGLGVELAPEKGWAPKCVVLLSYYAYYRAFAVWLQKVYALSVGGVPFPLERLVLNLWEAPLPRASHQSVQLRLPTVYAASSASPSVAFTTSITFLRPSSSSLPLSDFSYLTLFSRLSLSNVLLVLTAMLNEKKIVLFSSTPSILTPLSAAFLSLLFPLQWTSPYVPVVPALSSGILEAPMPVFVGVDGRYALHRLTSTDDACVVDVDGDEVRVHGKYHSMGEAALSQLKKELAAFAGLEAGREARESEFDELACRACFLHLFVQLLCDVDDCLLFPPISAEREPSFEQLFDLPAFVNAPHRKGSRSILRGLCSTQLFSHFIEEKTYSASQDRRVDLLFFDDCCRYEAEHRLARANKAQHVPLITRLTQHKEDSAVYLVPTPDTSDLPPSSSLSSLHRYPTWPALDPAKMVKPRPVSLKYLRDALTDAVPSTNAASTSASSSASSSPLLSGTSAAALLASSVPRGRHPPSFAGTAAVTPLTPQVYARGFLRELYAVWFELWSICLPVHPSPHSALVRVFTGLARMTHQGVEPDVGIYRSVLSMCGRWRMKEEASLIFDTMRRNGIKPSSLTYGAYTAALAESSNEAEMERERTRDKVAAVDTATTALLTNGLTITEHGDEEHHLLAAAAASGVEDVDSGSTLPSPPRGLYLDPYRLAADKHKRLILRAQRQRILWPQLMLSITHQCSACHYELSEGEVLTSWMPPSPQPTCPACHQPFSPQLSVVTPIVTHPPRLKLLVFRHVLHRPLRPVHRRYHISVPLLHASALRARFMSACSMFKEDLLNVQVMRVMHHVVYWNLVYHLSQPHNTWDLTFLVDDHDRGGGDDDKQRRSTRIRRMRKGDNEELDDSALDGDPLSRSAQKRARPNMQIRLSEGLRERQAGEAETMEPSDVALFSAMQKDDEEDVQVVTRPHSPTLASSASSPATPRAKPATTAMAAGDGSAATLAATPSLPTSLSIDTDLSAISTPLSATSSPTPARARSPSISVPVPALTVHEADLPIEGELSSLLSRRALQPAMEVFLKHRMRMRAERTFSPSAQPSASSTPRTRSSPAQPTALLHAWAEGVEELPQSSTSKALLVKRGNKQNSRASPKLAASVDLSSSSSFSFSDRSPPTSPHRASITSPPSSSTSSSSSSSSSHLQPARPPLSKSRSSNEVESLKTTLASVTSLALTAMRSGRHDLSPSQQHARALVPSPSSDSALLVSVWYPMRDAGPSIPLYLHCMFDVFCALGSRHFDSFRALCEEYDRAVDGVMRLYGGELTAMDRAPRQEVRVVELILGLRKREKKERKDKGDKEAGKAAQPGSAGRKRVAQTPPASSLTAAVRAEDDGSRLSAPQMATLVKSLSIPLKPAASAPPALPSSSSPTLQRPVTMPNGTAAAPPVSVTFPIAYPVGLSSSAAAASSTSNLVAASLVSPPPPLTPLTPSTPSPRSLPLSPPFPSTPPPPSHALHSPSTPFTPQYDAEVYSGPLSAFIAGTPDTRGQSPSASPSTDAKTDDEGEEDEEEEDDAEPAETEEDDDDGEAEDGMDTLPPLHSRQSSGGSVGRSLRPHRTGGAAEGGGVLSPSSPASPTTATSPVPASPPSASSSSAQQGGSRVQAGRERTAKAAVGEAVVHKARPPHAHPHPPPLQSTPFTPHNQQTAAAAASLHSAPLRLSTRSSTATSILHPPASSKSFTQSLYHFLMTKPTAASAASAGVSGRRGGGSGGSFTTGVGRGKLAAPGGGTARKVVSSGSVDSSAKRREDKDGAASR